MKDKFKILNDVDINLDEYEDIDIDKDKLKQTMRDKIEAKSTFKKRMTVAASIIVVSGGLIGIGIMNPSIASGIPIIENIFEDLNETLGMEDNYTEYAQGIGQSQTVDGNTVTIDEAVSDGHNLYLTYKIESKEKLPRSDYKPYGENSGDLMIYDDLEIDNFGEKGSSTGPVGYFKDDYTFIGVRQYDINFKDGIIPDKFNVKVNINLIGGIDSNVDGMIEGPFRFSLNIDNKASGDLINVNELKNEFKINYVEVSPYNISVDIEFPMYLVSDGNLDMNYLDIYDDKGQLLCRQGYNEYSIEMNKTELDENIVHDTISFNYKDIDDGNMPDYIVIKFETKEANKVEFKVDLKEK